MNCLFHLSTEAYYVLVLCYVIISNIISGQTIVHRPTVARSAACLAATGNAEPESIFSHSPQDYSYLTIPLSLSLTGSGLRTITHTGSQTLMDTEADAFTLRAGHTYAVP